METAYDPTYSENGSVQPKLHTKHYLHLKPDVHMRKGMLCQDCHTTRDLHGDGFLSGATLGPVEIECQDCHGTTKKYPWELPLGYSDEFATSPAVGKPHHYTIQKPKIENFNSDWSRFIDKNGNPVQTIDDHWNLAGPLSREALSKLDRRCTCLACHQSIPNKDIAVSLMSHVAQYAGIKINTREHESILHKVVLIGAWGQILFGLFAGFGLFFLFFRVSGKNRPILMKQLFFFDNRTH